MSEEDLRNKLEAILFASGKKLNVQVLKEITQVDNVRKVKTELAKLKEWYDKNNSVLMITQDGDLWKINVREKYSELVRSIVSEADLSTAVNETLSIIAWKSPAMQSDVINIRGSGAYDHIKELEESGFVTKEKHGRSYILKVTNKFFEYFDIDGAEGIKEIFEKIKESPPQKKVSEFKDEVPLKSQSNTEKTETVGQLEVVEVPVIPTKAMVDAEAEKFGKLEVYDEDKLAAIQNRLSESITDSQDYDYKPSEQKDSEENDEDEQEENRAKQIAEELLDENENFDQTPADPNIPEEIVEKVPEEQEETQEKINKESDSVIEEQQIKTEEIEENKTD